MRLNLLEELAESTRYNDFFHVVWALGLIAVVALMVVAPSYAAEVPPPAHAFKNQYTRIVRSEWGLSAPVASLAAQIHQESGWNCRAVSRVGARGCAQFMPTTAAWIGDVDHALSDGDVFSPSWAFRAQAVYVKWLHDRVKGPAPCERMAFALSAYNGGLGWVYRRQKMSTSPLQCFGATCDINPGVAPASQQENAQYPRRILLSIAPLYYAAGWGEQSC